MKRGGVFIILFFFSLTNCGGNFNSTEEPNDLSRNFIIDPTRKAIRDPDCPKPEKNNPFISEVISYEIGPGGGYHWKSLSQVVMGPPKGNGTFSQGVDVFSLGQGGHIIVKMGVPILDGEGVDFIVFENPFYISGDPKKPYAEPAKVSVSRDGINFKAFDCQNENWREFYPGCAGVNPVLANPNYNQIDPTDPKTAGGDGFDLKEVGLNCVQYIKIEDATEEIEDNLPTDQAGFDLDAISVVYY